MIDRLFTAVLAFAMLAFGAATVASLSGPARAAPRHVQLERVVITAKRLAPAVVAQADIAAHAVECQEQTLAQTRVE